MIEEDITVGEIYVLEKMREKLNHKGKELTPASDDNVCMENVSSSSSDDFVKYDIFDKSFDGSKWSTPGSTEKYKHGTDSVVS